MASRFFGMEKITNITGFIEILAKYKQTSVFD
jgi:hypothetical protein